MNNLLTTELIYFQDPDKGTCPSARQEPLYATEEQSSANSKADYVSLVATYNCFERDRNLSFLKVWHKVSENAFKNERYHRKEIYIGSYNEGLPKAVCNDIDMLVTLPHWPNVLVEQPQSFKKEGYVIQVPDTKYPAFLTLRVPQDEYYMSESRRNNNQDIKDIIVDLLSSAKMLDLNKRYGKRGGGPALTEKTKLLLSVDFIPCLEGPSWPPCASEFFTRPRPHGWPSKILLDKIRNFGYHVVAKGRHDSTTKDIEWSWGFCKAEQELIQNIDESKYISMYLLKAIKLKHWGITKQPGDPSIFTSYSIKTACLWIFEETPQNSEDILGLVEKVIDWLITSYRRKKMPHYFLPEVNLIARLEEDKRHFEQAVDWLEDIKLNLVDKIFTSIEFDENIEVLVKIHQHVNHSPHTPIPDKMMCDANYELRRDGEAHSKKERHALAKLASEFCFEVQDKIEDLIKEKVLHGIDIGNNTWQQLLGGYSKTFPNIVKDFHCRNGLTWRSVTNII